MIDSGAVRDPTRQLSAKTWNLLRSQVAGLGLVGPQAFVAFRAQVDPILRAHAELWNPRALTSSPFDPPTITRIGSGEYDIVYSSPVPDRDGSDVALSFPYGGWGHDLLPSNTVLRFVQVSSLSGVANGVKVIVRGFGGAAIDDREVAVWIG